jgi:hypothetical protein
MYLCCSFFQPPVTCDHVGTSIVFITLFSDTISHYFPLELGWQTKFHTHTKQTNSFVYFNLYVFGWQAGRQKKILYWLGSTLPQNWMCSDFFMTIILICYCHCQIFEFCHIFTSLLKNKMFLGVSSSIVSLRKSYGRKMELSELETIVLLF